MNARILSLSALLLAGIATTSFAQRDGFPGRMGGHGMRATVIQAPGATPRAVTPAPGAVTPTPGAVTPTPAADDRGRGMARHGRPMHAPGRFDGRSDVRGLRADNRGDGDDRAFYERHQFERNPYARNTFERRLRDDDDSFRADSGFRDDSGFRAADGFRDESGFREGDQFNYRDGGRASYERRRDLGGPGGDHRGAGDRAGAYLDRRDYYRGGPDTARWERNRYPAAYTSRQRYHGMSWRPPHGYYHRNWRRNEILPVAWYAPEYWLDDWWRYDLPEPPDGYDWVRVGHDALLVDLDTGRIVQVVRSVFA